MVIRNLLIITQLYQNGGLETRLYRLLSTLKNFKVTIAIIGNFSNLYQPIISNKNFIFYYFNNINELNESLIDIVNSNNINILELQICSLVNYEKLNYDLLRTLNIKLIGTIHFNISLKCDQDGFDIFKNRLKKYFDLIITNRPFDNQYLEHNNYKYIPNTSSNKINTIYQQNQNKKTVIITRLWKDKLYHIENYIQFLQNHNFLFDIAGSIDMDREKDIKNTLIEKYKILEQSFIGNICTIDHLKNNHSSYMFICGIGTVAIEAASLGYPVLLSHINEKTLAFWSHSNYSNIKDNNFTLPSNYKINNVTDDLKKFYKKELDTFLLFNYLQNDNLEPTKVAQEYENILLSLLKDKPLPIINSSVKCSIIITTYNRSNELKRSLYSALNQSCKEIEIIILDDNSTDNTTKVVKQFKEQDNRIQYIKSDIHVGQGILRNKGINVAKGEYLAFLDDDDFIVHNFVEKLYNDAKEHDADISKCNIIKTIINKPNILYDTHKPNIYTSLEEKNSLLWFGSFNSLYRKKFLINNNIYCDNNIYDEINFVYKAFQKSNKIVFLAKNTFYFYNKYSSNSITTNESRFQLFNLIKLSLLYPKNPYIERMLLGKISTLYIPKKATPKKKKKLKNLIKKVLAPISNNKEFLPIYNIEKYHGLLFKSNLKKHYSIKSIFDSGSVVIGTSPLYEIDKLVNHKYFIYYLNVGNSNFLQKIDYSIIILFGSYMVYNYKSLFSTNFLRDKYVVLAEDGFLRSVGLHYHKTKVDDKFIKPISFLVDDLGYHFSIYYPTRIELMLNNNSPLTQEQIHRAKQNIKTIKENNLTKYNCKLPVSNLSLPGKNKIKILVVAQKTNDASITNSNVNPETIFNKMLECAIRENPNADILIVEHMENLHAKVSCFKKINLSNVFYIKNDISIISVLDRVDKVYTVSSGVGLEAIIRNKIVVVFGSPSYAGWGLTDDRNPIFKTKEIKKRRSRKLTVEELFYRIYIDYTIYKIPGEYETTTIEKAINHLIELRDEFFHKYDKNILI
ncbi:cell surface saccharide synthesis protein [Candidatus Hepatincola sp. Av]